MNRRTLLALCVAAPLAPLAACSSPGASPGASPGTMVIDVRTPAEFEAGHVVGATNIDLEAADFDQRIGALAKGGRYLVYCRSGNRSARAAARMTAAGLTVTDGGGLDAMKQAGHPFTS